MRFVKRLNLEIICFIIYSFSSLLKYIMSPPDSPPAWEGLGVETVAVCPRQAPFVAAVATAAGGMLQPHYGYKDTKKYSIHPKNRGETTRIDHKKLFQRR